MKMQQCSKKLQQDIGKNQKLVYGDDDIYIKTKTEKYADSIVTDFHNKKVPKEKSPYECLWIILFDSVIKRNKKYYPQTFLEECKYVQEKIKIQNYIDDDLKSDSNSNEEAESDKDE